MASLHHYKHPRPTHCTQASEIHGCFPYQLQDGGWLPGSLQVKFIVIFKNSVPYLSALTAATPSTAASSDTVRGN